MNKIRINDLDVYYTDDDDIDNIIQVISNNYELFFKVYADQGFFFSTVPIDDSKCVYADDFDNSFATLARAYFDLTSDSEFSDHENLSVFYADVLLQESMVPNPFFEDDKALTPEILDTILAKQYYLLSDNFDGFLSYIKYRPKEEQDKIRMWLRESCRYETYNYILSKVSYYLKENGFDYLATSTSNNIFVDIIKSYTDKKDYDLPKVSNEDLDRYFYEFLRYINAPDSWRKLYNNLKRNNGIKIVETDDETKASKCYSNDIDEDYDLLVYTDGTTAGFCSLVHEFIHYVTLSYGDSNFALDEFPSIYFEKVAALFLKEKGYSNEVVEKTIEKRNRNNIDILVSLSTLFTDVNMFMKNGVVTREDKIDSWYSKMEGIYKLRLKANQRLLELGITPQEVPKLPERKEIEALVDEDCDYLTEQFITENIYLLDGYQYLLGSSLAEAILNKDGTTSTSKMIDVVEDITSYNANKIVSTFGININSDKNNKKEKKISTN